jgi:hypothetical protein
MNALETLSQKRAEVVGNIDAIKAKAAADNRVEFNEEESTQLDGLLAAADHLNSQIDRLKTPARSRPASPRPPPARPSRAARRSRPASRTTGSSAASPSSSRP